MNIDLELKKVQERISNLEIQVLQPKEDTGWQKEVVALLRNMVEILNSKKIKIK